MSPSPQRSPSPSPLRSVAPSPQPSSSTTLQKRLSEKKNRDIRHESDDFGGDRWADDRSRLAWDNYEKLKEIRNQQAALLNAEEKANFPTDDELWHQAVGEVFKRSN